MSASTKKMLRKEQTEQVMTERQKREKKEAKKTKAITASFIIIIAVIFCIVIGTFAVQLSSKLGLIERLTTAATVGEHKLNSIMMNYFFYDAIDTEYTNLQQTYGDYASSLMQVDLSKPLDEQLYDETGKTWADHYTETALENARIIYAMYDKAVADGFQLSEDMQASIGNSLMQYEWQAMMSGVKVNDVLRVVYGNGASEKSFTEYKTIQATATAYYQAHQDSLSYDDAAIRAFESEHFNDYSSYTFYSYQLSHTKFLPELPEGTEATEEQLTAARADAEAAANELAKATSVEELDAAIAELEINKDVTPVPTSTENKDVAHTELLADYAEWLGATDRVMGNTKAFPSKTTLEDGTEVTNTYYVLMFQSRDDNLEPLANVRHILINFEGGSAGEDGQTVYTDAEKAAAKTKAEALLQQWKEGEATEDSFVALVKENTGDTASAETGGLYEDIYEGANYEAAFLNWSVNPDRAAGDTGIVETSYGYHIMYYVGDDELTNRDYQITQDLISQDMTAWEESVTSVVTATLGNTSRINKDLVYMPATN